MASSAAPEYPTTGQDKAEEETIHGVEDTEHTARPKDLRFWLIIVSLLVSTFLSALDLTCEFS